MKFRLLVSLILGPVLYAQLPDLKTVLNLSDNQVQSLVQLQQQKPRVLEPLVLQLHQDQQLLEQLLATNPDPAAVGRLFLEISAITRQIQDAAAHFQQQAFSILLPDQQMQVRSLADVLRLQAAAQQAVALGLLSPPN